MRAAPDVGAASSSRSQASRGAGNRVAVMLDSGAFSVWRLGRRIDLSNYIRFCDLHADVLFKVINLDVIPAKPGVRASRWQVDESAAEGWKNWRRMRAAGIDSMPVFHYGEDRKWLDRYLDAGCTYIGLSVSHMRSDPMQALDLTWRYLCGSGGYPTVKVHGFALTSKDVFIRYPWYSVDSTSWIMAPSYGCLLIPGKGVNFDKAVVVPIADPPKNPKVFKKGDPLQSLRTGKVKRDLPGAIRKHYDHLSPRERGVIDGYLAQVGFTIEQMRERVALRCAVGAMFYNGLMRSSPLPRFLPPREGLMSAEDRSSLGTESPPRWKHARMFLGIPQSQRHMKALNRVGANDRLLSFLYYAEETPKRQQSLVRLARTGLFKETA